MKKSEMYIGQIVVFDCCGDVSVKSSHGAEYEIVDLSGDDLQFGAKVLSCPIGSPLKREIGNVLTPHFAHLNPKEGQAEKETFHIPKQIHQTRYAYSHSGD